MQQEILSKETQIKKNEIPKDYSSDCIDFINRMIKRKENERLGYENIKQIFKHPWLADVDFKKLYNKKIKSPLQLYENSNGNYDAKNVSYNKYLYLTNKTKVRYLNISKNKKEYQSVFKDYYFYFNEFDLFDRKNTKIINKFINPHKKYCESEEFNLDDIIFFRKNEDTRGGNFSNVEYDTTRTMSMEQRGEHFFKKKIKKKIIFDKDTVMDKENTEILKEEESLNDSVLDSDRKIINSINGDNFKKKLREFMNKN